MPRRILSLAAIAVAVVLLQGSSRGALTHYWTFDADLTDSVGSADGSAVGSGVSITSSAGEFMAGAGGLRVAHDTASGDYVDVVMPVVPTSNPATFTIAAWYRYEDIGSQTTDARNFVWETVPSFTTGFGLSGSAGNKDAEWFFSGGPSDTNGPIVDDGAWHHVAMVWDRPSGTASYYHDGQLFNARGTGGGDLAGQPTTGLHIGDYRAGNGARNWDGYIDDFAVFDSALNAGEIAALYDMSQTPATVLAAGLTAPNLTPIAIQPSGMIAEYRFETSGGSPAAVGSAGGQIDDTAGHANGPFHAVGEGSPAPQYIADPSPAGGSAFALDNDENVSAARIPMTATLADVTTGDFTLETWFRTTDAGRGVLIGSYVDGAVESVNLELHTANGVRLFIEGGATSTAVTDMNVQGLEATDTRDGQWHHLAGVRRGSKVEVWLDGQLVGETLDLVGAMSIAAENLYLGIDGRPSGAQPFDGDLDNSRIWGRALEPGEIASLALGAAPVPEPSAAMLAVLCIAMASVIARRRK